MMTEWKKQNPVFPTLQSSHIPDSLCYTSCPMTVTPRHQASTERPANREIGSHILLPASRTEQEPKFER